MFAIIETGGKQYKVEKGSVLDIELLLGKKEGDAISFNKVLLLSKKDNVEIGTPYIKDAEVSAKILSVAKDKKVTTFKFKRKTNYHRTIGHRQIYTRIKIEAINHEVKSA
jgi:large subunit ribosomal protein L21